MALAAAPRNAAGKVEFESDVYILAPQDPAKGNGAAPFDVHDRGTKLALRFFNDAPGGNRPAGPASAGNGFLFRRGYAVAWCGWGGGLLPGEDRLLLRVPVATDGGRPIRGAVRGADRQAGRVAAPGAARGARQLPAEREGRAGRRADLADAGGRPAGAGPAGAVVAGAGAGPGGEGRRAGRARAGRCG